MAERKAFALRIDPAMYDAMQRWADDELRSVNGQIEYLLRESLKRAGRLRAADVGKDAPRSDDPEQSAVPSEPRKK